MLESAVSYAERGLCVFPCAWIEDGACSCRDPECESPGKHPLTPHGLLDATDDIDQVRDFWTKFPKANIAIGTGAKSGIAVLDIDGVELARPELQKLLPGYDFKSVPVQKTGKGWHFIFSHPEVHVKTGTKFLPGMDSRGDGGYIIAAPSNHVSGKQYQWKTPLNGNVPALPSALLTAINGPSSNGNGEAKPLLDTSIIWEGIPEGQRDDMLFRYACKMRHNDTPRDLADRLICEGAARCKPPFPQADALRKVEQAYQKYPRGETSRTEPETADSVNASEWPEPQDLPDELPAVPAMVPEMIPESLRPWLCDIADRMQCPLEFPVIGAIVTAGSLIGRQLAIRPKRQDDWTVYPNLWGGVVGRPGIMKTPALDEAKKPLQRLEIAALQEHEKQKQAHEINLMVLKAKKEELQKKIKEAVANGASTAGFEIPTEDDLVLRRYMVNDSTVEKLGELLNQNPNGLLLFRDELTGWLRTLDREGHENDRASISNPGTETARTPMIESAAALSILRPRACPFAVVSSPDPLTIIWYRR
jgi:Bifunctional DNA primase/polymerase, N-terminal/Protein of unknown function (DUF3987)